jgi:hypothetical protein
MMSKDMNANANTNNNNMAQSTNVVVNVGGAGGNKVNHCCHFLLCLGTGGFWSPFWMTACCCGWPSLKDCPCNN